MDSRKRQNTQQWPFRILIYSARADHQMYVRARQSALRRYFFASPRIFVAIMCVYTTSLAQAGLQRVDR